jgi:putative copper resistance protein D
LHGGAATGFVLQGGVPLLLARALFVAGILSLGGTLVFGVTVAPCAFERMSTDRAYARRVIVRWALASLLVSLAGIGVWTALETAELAGTGNVMATLREIWPVLTGTLFGQVVLLQVALLLMTGLLLTTSGPMGNLGAAVSASACVAAEAAHGHGMAMGGVLGPWFGRGVLHLLAASIWIGGLPPLLLVVWLMPPLSAARAARWFSPVGKWAVVVLAASALAQAWRLVGSVTALLAVAYGWMVLIKAALFVALLGLALLNRYHLAPALVGSFPGTARRRLAASILVQTSIGVAAVLAAATLSGLTPGMGMGKGGS